MEILIEFVCKHHKILEDHELENFLVNSICGITSEEANKTYNSKTECNLSNSNSNTITGSNLTLKPFIINLLSIYNQ
jgi:hypothetical protein